MSVKIVATGSTGNSYIFKSNNQVLLLELGINFKTILKHLDYKLDNVLAAFITHEHIDHSKSVKEAINYGIDVYMSKGTKEGIKSINNLNSHRIHLFDRTEDFNYSTINISNFKIKPFRSEHDVNESNGFLIVEPNGFKTVFLTDSYYCRYKFKPNRVLIECNYDDELIPYMPKWRARVIKSHMGLNTLKETLKSWDLTNCKDIVLIHLSGENGNTDKFKKEIEELTGIKTYIAEEGLEIE